MEFIVSNFNWIALAAALVGLGFAFYTAQWLLQQPTGDAKMAKIALAIQRGAQAFLNREYRYVAILIVIVVVTGGIYSCIFTPTEAAAMSAVYAFVIAVFVYKDLKFADVPKVLLNSANMSAMLLYIITNAMLFAFILTNEQIPQGIAEWLLASGLGVIGFLIVVNILLLLMGNFMEPSSIILITAPILFPIAMKLGIDPIHFGIMIVVNMEIGMITPPVGLNLYVASGISKLGLTECTIAVWPWLLTMLAFLMLITYVPEISIWLPRTLGMM